MMYSMGIGPFPRNEAKNDFFSSAKSVFQEGSCARSKESQHPLMPIMEIVMPRRKSKFQDSEFVRIATFSVGSERLRIDEGGRIEEDPELLISFGKLVDQMSVAAGVNFKFCQICVLEGAYVSDVLGVKSLANQRDEIVALFNRFEDDVEKLERNVDADEPGNASKCGVSNMSLGVLEASAALSGSSGEAKANIMLDDGHKIDIIHPIDHGPENAFKLFG